MNYHFWTKQELALLEEWDWVMRYRGVQLTSSVDEEDVLRRVHLEARLLIANKLVVVYNKETGLPSGIYSFKEYIEILEKSNCGYLEFTYHPVNFKSPVKYKNFISKMRDEVFSMIK